MATAIAFILVFGIIVLCHELGHFATAKWNGIFVHEFAIGMGPKIFKHQGKETLYTIRLLPIGGYVRMEGEDEVSDDPRSFSNKKPWQRFMVISAGAIMNFILALVLLTLAFGILGEQTLTIDSFVENYPAESSGLQVGDTVTAINDQTMNSWTDLTQFVVNNGEKTLTMHVERDGVPYSFTITPEVQGDRYLVGIVPARHHNPGTALVTGVKYTGQVMGQIIDFLIKLPQGKVQGDVVGPVGIVKQVDTIVNTSPSLLAQIINLMSFAAIISVNLGIVNLLPFPALDGGRLVFIIIEMIKGSPVDQEKEAYVHAAGMIVLLGLMAFMIVRDIMAF